MRIPDPIANTTTEAYLAYKAGYLEQSELKPKLYEPYLHFDAWLAYWAGLTGTYPEHRNTDGKNIMPLKPGTISINGVDVTISGDGTVTIDGTTTAAATIKLSNGIDTNATAGITRSWLDEVISEDLNGECVSIKYVSGTAPNVSCALRIYSTTSSPFTKQWYFYNYDQDFAFTTSSKATCIVIYMNQNLTFDKYKFKVQLEEGDTPTDYSPYLVPEMLTDEEALVAYLSGVTDTYPESIKDPEDVRITGYLRHLVSARWPEPDYPVNNEEFYLSTMEPTHTSNSVPSSDIELDTAEGKFIDVKAYGNATQTTYSGKNLFGWKELTFTSKYYVASWSLSDDGKLTVTPYDTTNSMGLSFYLPVSIASGATVTLSSKTQLVTSGLNLLNEEAGWAASFGTGYQSVTKTLTSKAVRISFSWLATGSTTPFTVDLSTMMIELGSSATSYEPYVGGIPAPNPDCPQPISTVTGENVVKVVGKNLFDTDTAVTRFEAYNGNAFNDWGTYSDGIVTIVKSNGAHGTCAFAGFKPRFIEGQTYTLSAEVYLEGTNASKQLRFGTVTNLNTQITIASKDEWLTVAKTFTATASDVSDPRIDIQAYNTGNTLKIKHIQLELGNSATSYQSYTAQDYAINLTGKNLFNKATSTDGYRIDSNGNPYANASYFISDYIAVQPSTTYAYSRGAAGSGLATIAYYKSDKTFISRTMPTIGSSDTSGTVTTPDNARYARFCDVNEVLDSAQLELGSTATEYAAYSPIELAKIGTYQDRIYKDGEKWYVEKNVGKATLDGSEEYIWNYNSGTYSGFYRAVDSVLTDGIAKVDDARLSKSNNFTCESTNTTWTGAGRFGFSSTWTMWFELMDNTITTYRDFNTWLASHPTTVYYPLATPTTTEITNSELIAQLDALMEGGSYNGKTYIKVTANDPNLPALLKVEAYSY